jgi:peptide/nickel transport system permease protein
MTAGLWPWLVRRLLLAVWVMIGAASAAFIALHMLPGDPAVVVLGMSSPTPQVIAQVRIDLGMNLPLAQQYLDFLGRLARGDFGTSYQEQQSVTSLIGSQVWSTAQLAASAFVLAMAVSVGLALAAAGRRPLVRRLCSLLELISLSTADFWVAILLLTAFSFRLRLFPAAGGTGPAGLVLPAVALAFSLFGLYTQVLREGMEHALRQPFAVSALARGGSGRTLRLRHALRHGLTPLVTLSGWTVGTLMGGAVLIETVFSRPGIGRLLATAVAGRDLPTVTGVVVLGAAVFSVVNITVDVLYRVVDPRLREARW